MKSPESPGLGHDNVVIHVEALISARIQRMGHARPIWGTPWRWGTLEWRAVSYARPRRAEQAVSGL